VLVDPLDRVPLSSSSLTTTAGSQSHRRKVNPTAAQLADSHWLLAAERVATMIQAALGCRPMLERVLVEDDIRAETKRVPSVRRQMHEPGDATKAGRSGTSN
jgi:hypothetical protein